MNRFMVSIAALALLAVPSAASAFLGAEVAVGGWSQDPSGYASYASVDQLDLETDANYDSEMRYTARAKLELPLILPNIYVMATPMEYEGDGSKSFSFGGANIVGNFHSKTTLDHYDVALFWGIPLLKTATLGKFNVEWGINIRFVDYETTVTDLDSIVDTDTSSESLVVPMVYVGAELAPVKSFAIQAEVRAIEYSGSSYYDYIVRLKYKPFIGPLFIGAGYRIENITIDEGDTQADVDFAGPFVELGLKL